MLDLRFALALRMLAGLALTVAFWGTAQAQSTSRGAAAPAAATAPAAAATPDYRIVPGDGLQIFVWHNPDLSTNVSVRPDGKISIPLVEDMVCVGRTPSELARAIEATLTKYVTNPIVTVMMTSYGGSYDQEVRIVGEAVTPKALFYKRDMTLLDAMIEVGGLTRFAAGNSATLVRTVNGARTIIKLNIGDLLKDGDVRANVPLRAGDVIIIPQSYF